MSRRLDLFLEWLAPGRIRRAAIPPLEAGLRPNDRLERARVLHQAAPRAVDDLAVQGGQVYVTTGNELCVVGSALRVVATLPAPATALAALDGDLAVAVAGEGILRIREDGTPAGLLGDDVRLRSGVTAMTAGPDGSLLVCVGSTTAGDWPDALVSGSATGLLLSVGRTGAVTELASGLAWPSGAAVTDREILLSVSHRHRVERRSHDGVLVGTLISNMPGYPGRIAAAAEPGEWWLAVPYMRNRATELVLEEAELRDAMTASSEPTSWLLPQLGIENEYRTPLQVGQIRVLGEIKPWAPPRTYGLVLRFTQRGQIIESAHSRADGERHGATAVIASPRGTTWVACAGSGALLELEEGR